MLELFTELLKNLNSSVFILVALMFVVIFIVYKIGAYTERFTGFEKQLSKADVFQDNTSQELHKLIAKMDIIYSNVVKNATTQGQSPLQLTQSGLDISSNLKTTEILERVINDNQDILNQLSKNKNAYDIQKDSMSWAKQDLATFLTDSELLEIKEAAFNQAILKEDILAIFGIEIRNKILKNLNLNINEIDKSNPTIQDEKIS